MIIHWYRHWAEDTNIRERVQGGRNLQFELMTPVLERGQIYVSDTTFKSLEDIGFGTCSDTGEHSMALELRAEVIATTTMSTTTTTTTTLPPNCKRVDEETRACNLCVSG